MPKALERKLWRGVQKKHPRWSKERKRAYVYGSMRNIGWTPSTQRKLPVWKRSKVTQVSSRHFKGCVIHAMSRSNITSPTSARNAFRAATARCRRFIKYGRR